MLISACMIVKNEAHNLPKALRSLQGLVSEIVVVDTGSSDGTQALCRGAGCVLVEDPWQGSFSAARNRALAAARGRFCLSIDADEEVQAETWPALLRFLEEGRHALGRVWVASDTEDGTVREAITRLYPNDGRFRFAGRIHEQIVQLVQGGAGKGAPATRGDTGLVLRHSGYTREALAGKRTTARNLELLRLDLADEPGDPYILYQIGRCLWQERPAEAVRAFEQSLSRVAPDAPYLPGMIRELGYALRAAGQGREALALVRAYQARMPDFTDLFFLEGLLHMDMGEPAAMVRAFERCLELGDGRGDSRVDGVSSYRPHYNLGLFHELSGQIDRARHHYEQALRARPDFAAAAARLAALDSTDARRGP